MNLKRNKFKDLDGYPTPWNGKHTKWHQRLIYKLYKKYVNEPFIPKNTVFTINRYPRISKKEGIESIKMSFKGLNTGRFEQYIFSEFYKIND